MLSDQDIDRIADRIIEALGGRLSQSNEILDAHGAAELLGCSVPTIERRTRDGSIPSVRIGRLRRYRRSDLTGLNTNTKRGAV